MEATLDELKGAIAEDYMGILSKYETDLRREQVILSLKVFNGNLGFCGDIEALSRYVSSQKQITPE